MRELASNCMVFAGSLLMVYNIYCFVRFAHNMQEREMGIKDTRILYLPIVLLVLFLMGYIAVGLFGAADLVVSSILFGGSIFVFAVYRLLDRITRRIAESEELKAELMAAEKSSQAKSSFLASMSHEMRTPMNVIIGLDEVALKNPSISNQTRSQLEKIGLSAQHLLGLINNILDMNQAETGRLELRDEEFSLREALNQVDAIVQSLCEEKGLDYSMRLDGLLAHTYKGDVMQLKQVLLSILNNAVKYTDAPGSVWFEVDSSSLDQGDAQEYDSLRFSVRDTGVGMDEDFVPKVFDAFAQEDSTSTSRFGGGGLSLAVAKSAVDAMGGTIEVTSEKHKGSTFVVTLPLRVVCREAAKQPQPSVDGANIDSSPTDFAERGVDSLDGRRILIVEDVEDNAEIVADLLELEGASSDHAQNGKVAVDMFSASDINYFDAVLMDLRMPVMDGLEAARRIRRLDREDARDVPIVALSANAYESDVQQVKEAGMTEHLSKPVDVDKLYSTLMRLIRTNAVGTVEEQEGENVDSLR